MSKGKIHKYIAKDLSFRASVAIGTDVVREMQALQNTYPLATMAVGRSMMGAALLASQLKNEQLVSLYFRGNGPLEMFFAEANFEGNVRGYTPFPQLDFRSLDVGEAVGIGLLTVVHSHPQQKAPQRGTVELKTGQVADDIAYYLMQSQQVRSAVALGVKVNAYGMVQGAGGILLELMPGTDEKIIEQLEKNFSEKTSISEMISNGGDANQIVGEYLKGFAVVELDHPYELAYQCRCSKERLGNALALLGHFEVEKMIQENKPAEATCEFCGRQYTIEIAELEILLEKLRAGPTH